MNTEETHEEPDTVHIVEYYYLLLRQKWTILLVLLLVLSLVLLYNSRLVPVYKATATIIIDKEKTTSPLTGERMDYDTYLSESLTFNTHFQLIVSRPILELVIQDMGLTLSDLHGGGTGPGRGLGAHLAKLKENARRLLGGDRETHEGLEDPTTALVETLRNMIEIEHVEDTRLLRIQAFDTQPETARDIANALAKAYIHFNVSNRLQASQNTLAWLSDQLYDTKKKLEDAEAEFLEFKQKEKIVSPEGSQQVIAQKMSEFNDAYIQARNKRLELDSKLEELSKVSPSGRNLARIRSLIDNPLINDLYAKLVDAEVERSRLAKVFKSKHPNMIQVQTSIDQILAKLNEELRKELDNLRAERALLVSREAVLQKTMADFEEEGLQSNKKEIAYAVFQRNAELNRELYNTLLTRLKEVDITGNIDVSNIRITEEAAIPEEPVAPNKSRNLVLGALFGLMLAVGLSFFREYLDRTIRTEEDVRNYLSLPVLAVIPVAERNEEKARSDWVLRQNQTRNPSQGHDKQS
jgi:uncharacterized protein involved in exopolysaccharide biosynthesis